MTPSSSFVANARLPIHRWFRYSAGFSGEWAEREICAHSSAPSLVLDPFAGVATTLVAAQLAGRSSIGLDAHPFVARLGRAKLSWASVDPDRLGHAAAIVAAAAAGMTSRAARPDTGLLTSAFSAEALTDLRRLQRSIAEIDVVTDDEREMLWFALVAILRACSTAATAPWQYVQPRKRKANVSRPFDRFVSQVRMMVEDMRCSRLRPSTRAAFLDGDARTCGQIDPGSVDLVVTSPPYPNNYDYADATRLEQTFLGELTGWGDLQEVTRRFLVRACSQHSAAERLNLETLLADDALQPIRPALDDVCGRLAQLREARPGRKTYHTMIAAYFADMAKTWMALARAVRRRGKVVFVIGDSAPYGIHVPADEWMRALADAAGFAFLGFREIRKRNLKWKNRKHRVPLKEGELLVVRRDV
jgi:hypothetical protein